MPGSLEPVLNALPRNTEPLFLVKVAAKDIMSELREQVEAIKRWYRNDWIALDNKLRSQ